MTPNQKDFERLKPLYIEAYNRANNKVLNPDFVQYKNGYVYIGNPEYITSKMRIADFENAIDNLNERADREQRENELKKSFPMFEKMKCLTDAQWSILNEISEFIDGDRDLRLHRIDSDGIVRPISLEQVVYRALKIDEKKLEQERKEMLNLQRQSNG